MDCDPAISILADFSSRALRLLAGRLGRPIATVREGMLGVWPSTSRRLANKVQKLNLAYSVVRHLTKEYSDDLVLQPALELDTPIDTDDRSPVPSVALGEVVVGPPPGPLDDGASCAGLDSDDAAGPPASGSSHTELFDIFDVTAHVAIQTDLNTTNVLMTGDPCHLVQIAVNNACLALQAEAQEVLARPSFEPLPSTDAITSPYLLDTWRVTDVYFDHDLRDRCRLQLTRLLVTWKHFASDVRAVVDMTHDIAFDVRLSHLAVGLEDFLSLHPIVDGRLLVSSPFLIDHLAVQVPMGRGDWMDHLVKSRDALIDLGIPTGDEQCSSLAYFIARYLIMFDDPADGT